MSKLTKAQARKRLKEALNKAKAVYMAGYMTIPQMKKIEDAITHPLKRLE